MGWQPEVRCRTRAGRQSWYTLTIHRKEHYLGSDPAQAYERAAKLMKQTGLALSAPDRLVGLVAVWVQTHPGQTWRWYYWCDLMGEKPLAELEPADMQRLADHLTAVHWQPKRGPPRLLAPWTIRHRLQDARTLWHWAQSQGWIATEPGRAVSPRPTQEPRDEDPEVIEACLAKIRSKHAIRLLRFIAATGCRPKEARLLRWSEVDLKHGVCQLADHKGRHKGQTRTLYLTPEATSILESQSRVGQYVFPSSTGQPYTQRGLRSITYRAGLSSTYALRHTFAQWFLDHGNEGEPGLLQDLQELLGHKHVTTTQIYARVRSRRARDVASRLHGPLTG